MEAFRAAVGAEILGAVAGSVVTVALTASTPLLLKGSPTARANNAEQHLKAAIDTLAPEAKRMAENVLSEAGYQIRKTMDARIKYEESTAFFERLSYSVKFERLGMKAHKTAQKASNSTRQEYLSIEIHAKVGPYDKESENPFRDPKDLGKDPSQPTFIKKFLARITRNPVKKINIPLRPIPETSKSSPEGDFDFRDQGETLHEFSIEIEEEQSGDDSPSTASSSKQGPDAEASLATSDLGVADVTVQVVDDAALPSA